MRISAWALVGAALAVLMVAAVVNWSAVGEASKTAAAPTLSPANGRAADTAEKEAPKRPTFDVVRISREGLGVLAGRAEPEAEVTVLAGETVLARTRADGSGEWALVLEEGLSPGLAKLSLHAAGSDGAERRSPHLLIVAVPDAEAGMPASRESGILAVLTPEAGEGGSQIMQRPGLGASGPSSKHPHVETIDYDDDGGAVVSGRAAPRSRLAVALDDRRVGIVESDHAGRWQVTLDRGLTAGAHVLQLSRLDASDMIVSQVEQRFTAGPVVELPPGGRGIALEVQENFWALVRGLSERERRYTLIFDRTVPGLAHPPVFLPG